MSHKKAKNERREEKKRAIERAWQQAWEDLIAEQDAWCLKQQDKPCHDAAGMW